MGYGNFTRKQLEKNRVTKKDLAEIIGLHSNITFDYAIPHDWLTEFAATTVFDYQFIRETCFTVYDTGILGRIVSGCTEIQAEIDKMRG